MFQLDPENLTARARSGGSPPSLGESVARGALGFMVVAAIGFAPWAIFEAWFRSMREAQLYTACTLAFIAASGPMLHRLIIGPGSLPRFYKLFGLAFTAYAGAWIACWTTLHGREGELLGLATGSMVLGAVVAFAFRASARAWIGSIASIFAGNLGGYYLGARLYETNSHTHRYGAMIAWGVCFGLGFGAGLGLAFYLSQGVARARLRSAP
jgi:hypothetical protein